MRNCFQFILATLITFQFYVVAAAQQPWEGKDYKQWSGKDAEKVLEQGPWTATRSLTTMSIQQTRSTGSNNDAQNRDSQIELIYTVQLYSAKPVREAFMRRAQNSPNYMKMTDDKRKQVDANLQQFVEQNPGDIVVVHVSFKSLNSIAQQNASLYWQQATLERILNTTNLLTSDNQKVSPIAFTPALGDPNAFELQFPRTFNGKPVLEAGKKNLGLEFQVPTLTTSLTVQGIKGTGISSAAPATNIGGQSLNATTERVYFEFKSAKMSVNGALEY